MKYVYLLYTKTDGRKVAFSVEHIEAIEQGSENRAIVHTSGVMHSLEEPFDTVLKEYNERAFELK